MHTRMSSIESSMDVLLKEMYCLRSVETKSGMDMAEERVNSTADTSTEERTVSWDKQRKSTHV